MAKVFCVKGCDNSQRKPNLVHAKFYVRKLRWHRLPNRSSSKTSENKKQWVDLIKKGKKDFKPSDETFVCSNHFVDGESTQSHRCQTLFLRSATSVERKPFNLLLKSRRTSKSLLLTVDQCLYVLLKI